MTSKRSSTINQINELFQPCPELGSESDIDSDTNAKLADFDLEDGAEVEQRRSNLSQVNVFTDNPRYTGVKVTRKKADISGTPKTNFARDDVNSDKLSSNISSDSGDSDDGDIIYDEDEEEDDEADGYSDTSKVESDSEDLNDSSSKSDCIEPTNIFEEERSNSIQHISGDNNLQSEIEKANSVKNQLYLWDKILECRIRVQKSLTLSNKFPKHNAIEEFKLKGGQSFSSEIEKTEKHFTNLLNKLINLQKELICNYSETKDIGQILIVDKNSAGDEVKELDVNIHANESQKFEDILASLHDQYSEFRNATIQKWNDRTKVSHGRAKQGDFSSFEQTTLQQIQHILSNKKRLVLRTRLRGSVGHVLGDPDEEVAEHDSEIFDDSDFYHQLLKEIIERHGDGSHDSTAIGRRWAAIQKLRSKMKRRVDTRATKGRRLRYNPYPKLVGLMAPVMSPGDWDERATTELFSSLFGKKNG